ncbi:unnamed protein product [Allacma fusca]|uniref:Uncharacterized protein n=1 Tax=Allacma fusca TaxID=39272 RepID=A0A8J2L1S1_9HEXA|nr:unnamed protein product [Allacma fusca]
MSPSIFQGILHHLKESNELKFLEALAELQKDPSNDLTPEDLVFSNHNNPQELELSQKFSTPPIFLSQPSFNDILPTNPCYQLPLLEQLAISTLDKVIMDSLLLTKPKDTVTTLNSQFQKAENIKALNTSLNSLTNPSPLKIPAHLCSFNIDPNAIASLMSSSASSSNNDLNPSFCHDWWFPPNSSTPPAETKGPSESHSSKDTQVLPRTSRTSPTSISTPTASKSSSGRASKRQGSCSSTKFNPRNRNHLITPTSSHTELQSVKILLNTGEPDNTDGSDGESPSNDSPSGRRRKLPNTHKKGQPSILLGSRRSPPPRRSRQTSRPGRRFPSRTSRISQLRATSAGRNARGRQKRAPKH